MATSGFSSFFGAISNSIFIILDENMIIINAANQQQAYEIFPS
jgi:hypothetical protein